MIHHIVLFRFRHGTSREKRVEAEQGLLGLKGRIPEIEDIRFGPNLGPSAAQWPYVLVVMLQDMEAVGRYLEHPAHREVVDSFLGPIREDRLAIDVAI